MWQTSDGIRVLTVGEWNLFAEGLDDLTGSLEEDLWRPEKETKTGVRIFDALTPAQKLALLASVATALRDPAIPAPPHTAAGDGAAAAVFASVRSLLETELRGDEREDDGTRLRQRIRAAYRSHPSSSLRLPPPTRKGIEAWEVLLEGVEQRVYWDREYGLGILDDPEATQPIGPAQHDPNYFGAIPHDPDEAGVTAARQVLSRLLGWEVPADNGLFPALLDRYHDLFVGPRPPEAEDEWRDHPWVEIVDLGTPDWACDYSTWLAVLRPAVPDIPYTVPPVGQQAASPNKEKRGRSAPPMRPVLPAGVRAEQRGSQWVITDKYGSWRELICNSWGDEADALGFPTEEEACWAYTQASKMWGEVAERSHAPRERLGLPNDD